MEVFLRLNISGFTILICLIMSFNIFHRNVKVRQYGFIHRLLYFNIGIVCLNMVTNIIDGNPGKGFLLLIYAAYFFYYFYFSVFVYFIFTGFNGCIVPGICSPVFMRFIFIVPLVVQLFLNLTNIFTHAIYYLDSTNHHIRGPLFAVFISISYIYVGLALLSIIINRKKLEKRAILTFSAFCLLPSIGGLLELYSSRIFSVWNFTMLAILVLYFYIENISLNTDYLTGIFNRSHLDRFIAQKISRAPDQTFCGILIDVNNFKEINDTFGHKIGDEALETTARLLKNALQKNDFLARFGGDEFVILKNVNSISEMRQCIWNIEKTFQEYNENAGKPYVLSLSYGYDVYRHDSNMTSDQFFEHIDTLMYEDKRARKKISQEAERYSAATSHKNSGLRIL